MSKFKFGLVGKVVDKVIRRKKREDGEYDDLSDFWIEEVLDDLREI